jgi:hypothetical protein
MMNLKLCYGLENGVFETVLCRLWPERAHYIKKFNLILKPRVGEGWRSSDVEHQLRYYLSKRDRDREGEGEGKRERNPKLSVTSETCTYMKNDKRSTCTSIMILRRCMHTYNDDGNDRRWCFFQIPLVCRGVRYMPIRVDMREPAPLLERPAAVTSPLPSLDEPSSSAKKQ